MEKDLARTPARSVEFTLSTDEFAARNLVKAQTVRKQLCQTGGYMGIVPKKLSNRRLAWPDVQV